jgi:hypothetical protein
MNARMRPGGSLLGSGDTPDAVLAEAHGTVDTLGSVDDEPETTRVLHIGPGRRREQTRTVIALGLLMLLTLVSVLPLLLLAFHQIPSQDARDYLERVFPAVLTLAGSAFGFYFGQQR